MSEIYSQDAKIWYAKFHTLKAEMEEIERITWREGDTMAAAAKALHDIRRIAKAHTEAPEEDQASSDWRPASCKDRSSCAKHGRCMYLGCEAYRRSRQTTITREDLGMP